MRPTGHYGNGPTNGLDSTRLDWLRQTYPLLDILGQTRTIKRSSTAVVECHVRSPHSAFPVFLDGTIHRFRCGQTITGHFRRGHSCTDVRTTVTCPRTGNVFLTLSLTVTAVLSVCPWGRQRSGLRLRSPGATFSAANHSLFRRRPRPPSSFLPSSLLLIS